MKTIPFERFSVAELQALADAPRLAAQAAVLVSSAFCTGAVARDGNGAPTYTVDSRARQFSIDGALERIRDAIGLSEDAETWVLRAYRELFGAHPCLDNDKHNARTAADALRHCEKLLRQWTRESNA
jgi:hypothetical protein